MSMVPWPKRRNKHEVNWLEQLDKTEALNDTLRRAEAAIANTVKHEFRPSSQPRLAAQIAADIDANDVDLQITERRLAEIRETGVALRIELAKSLEAIHEHTEVLRNQYLGGHNASNHHDSAATVDGNDSTGGGQAGAEADAVPVAEPSRTSFQGQEAEVPARQG